MFISRATLITSLSHSLDLMEKFILGIKSRTVTHAGSYQSIS